jgi:pimeloyl-ACP methyl ester carboxylesterase
MAAAGIGAWGFDLAGYGHSQRYPQQSESPVGSAPLGRAPAAASQIERVVAFLRREHKVGKVSLVVHSWGSLGACLFAGRHPDWVDRLVLFAPIARRQPDDPSTAGDLGGLQSPEDLGAWYPLTVQAQYNRFVEDLPPGHPPVLTDEFDQWSEAWLDTDPVSRDQEPPSVRTPSGPIADIAAAWSGELAYDPALLLAPTCIVRGEWDSLCTDADARWLFDSLTHAPMRRDVKIGAGTHLMHLESSRLALYREAISFLAGADSPSASDR